MTNSLSLYLITVMIWGTTWFAIKFQLGVVAPEVSLVYRFLLAAVVLFVFCLVGRRRLRFTSQQHVFMALQGLFLFSSNYLIFYWATEILTSGLIAVVFSTIIFMNIIIGAVFFGQRIRGRVLFGAALGLVGIALIFSPELRAFDASGHGLRGLAMSLIATALASIGNVLSARNQRHGLPVVQTNAWGMAYGTLVMAMYAVLSGAVLNYEATWSYSLSLFYLGLFGSVLAFGSYLTLIGRIGADRGAYAAVAFPVVALMVSTLFEDYRWSLVALIGLLFVIAGNVLVVRTTGVVREGEA